MQKNILILCRYDERQDYDQVNTYRHAMSSIAPKNSYSYGELEKLIFYYDGVKLSILLNDRDISEYDGVFLIGWFKTKILEDIALSVATYMHAHNKIVLNTEALFTRSRTKLSQYVVAALNGITLTPFLFVKDKGLLKHAFDEIWTLDFPVIMKGVMASRGNDNYLLQDASTVMDTVDTTDDENGPWFVVQQFVPNDGDYRVIVMGDQVKYVIHRKSHDETSHLNNTSKGGMATEVAVESLPANVRDQCALLAKLMRREITGVDMIQHKTSGKYYLLEINNMLQMATGSMVPQKMKYLDEYFLGLQ